MAIRKRPVSTAIGRILNPHLAAVTALAAPGLSLALPGGGAVVSGSAALDYAGPELTVNQSTSKAIINWQDFSIAADEAVAFAQPGRTAITLNRVVGGNASEIFGRLSANGQVFLVNQNGIYFGGSATVDVGGLVASTLDIRDQDFLSGNYLFTRADGASAGTVVNEGTIRSADGGYVVLAGARSGNAGLIQTRLGTTALAAGDAVTLELEGDSLISFAVDRAVASELAGVENTGEIIADGGRVYMTARTAGDLVSTAVNQAGTIRATGIAEQDGEIWLTGEGGDIAVAGQITADAGSSGPAGLIRVETDRSIEIADGAYLSAGGGEQLADGGEIRVIADDGLFLRGLAEVSVDGGTQGGNGGFLELSGKQRMRLDGDYHGRAHAPGYSGGSLLLDPDNITIVNGGTYYPTGNVYAGDSAGTDFTIDPTSLSLAGWSDVVLQAGSNIYVNSAISDTDINYGTPGGGLTLDAGNSIYLNADVGTSANRFNHHLTLRAGNDILLGSGAGASIWMGSYDLTAQANSGSIVLSQSAGMQTRIDIGGQLDLSADLIYLTAYGAGATVDVRAAGGIRMAAATDLAIRASGSSAGGQVRLETAGLLELTGGGLLLAADNGRIDAVAGQAALSGASIALFGNGAAGQVSIAASSGMTASASGGFTVRTGLTEAGSVTLDGGTGLTLAAGNNLDFDAGTGQIGLAAGTTGDVLLQAGTNLYIDSAIANTDFNHGVAGGSLILEAGESIYLNGNVGSSSDRFNHNLTLAADNHIYFGSNRSVWMGSNALVATADADGVGGGALFLETDYGTITVDTLGSAVLAGDMLNAWANGSTGRIRVTAQNGITLAAASNLAMSAASLAGIEIDAGSGDLNATAGGAARFTSWSGTGSIALAGRNVTISAASIALSGRTATPGQDAVTVTAVNDITLNATGWLGLAGSGSNVAVALTAGRDVVASAGSVDVGGWGDASVTVDAARHLAITAPGITISNTGSVGSMQFLAGQNLSLNGDGGSIYIEHLSGSTRLQAGGILDISAVGGNFEMYASGSAAGPLQLLAGDSISATANGMWFTAGNGASVSLAGPLGIALNAGGYFYATGSNGGSVSFTGDQLNFAGGDDLDIWATGGTVALNGTDINISATDVDLYADSGSGARIDVTATGSLDLSGSRVAFRAGGGATVNAIGQNVAVTGERIAISTGSAGGGSSSEMGPMSMGAAGTVDLTAANQLTLNAVGSNSSAGIYLFAGSGGSASAHGRISLEAASGNLALAAVRQLSLLADQGQVQLSASGQTTLFGDGVRLSANGGSGAVTVDAGAGITVDAASDLGIYAASISSYGTVALDGGTGLTLAAGNDLTFDAGSGQITLAAGTSEVLLQAGNNLYVQSRLDNNTINHGMAGGLTLEAGASIHLNGDVGSSSHRFNHDLTLAADEHIFFGSDRAIWMSSNALVATADRDGTGSGDLRLESGDGEITIDTLGSIALNADVIAMAASGSAGRVSVSAQNGINLQAAASLYMIANSQATVRVDAGSGDLALTVGGMAQFGGIIGSGSVALAGRNVAVSAASIGIHGRPSIPGGDGVTLTAANDILLNAVDQFTLAYGGSDAIALTAGRDILAQAGRVEVSPWGNATVIVDAGRNLAIAAPDIAVHNSGSGADIQFIAGQDLSLTAPSGSVSIQQLAGTTRLQAGGMLNVDAAGGAVQVMSRGVAAAPLRFVAGDSISVSANTVQLEADMGGSLELAGALGIGISAGSSFLALGRNGGAIALTGEQLNLSAGSYLSIDADAGSVALNGTDINVAGNEMWVTADSGGLLAVTATQNLGITAATYLYALGADGGALALAGDQLTVAGGDVDLRALNGTIALNGTNIDISGTEVELHASGSSAAARIDIHATSSLALNGGAWLDVHAQGDGVVSASGLNVTVSGDRISIAAGHYSGSSSGMMPPEAGYDGAVDISAAQQLAISAMGSSSFDGLFVHAGAGNVRLEAAASDLTLSAAGQLELGAWEGRVDLLAGGQATLSGDSVLMRGIGANGVVMVTATGIAVNAATDLAISAASLASFGRVELDADSALTLSAGNDLRLDASSGQIALTAGASGDVLLQAGNDIWLQSAIDNEDINRGVAGGSLTLEAGGSIHLDGDIGSSGARFNHALTLAADDHIHFGNDRALWMGSHALTVAADHDGTGSGDLWLQTDYGQLVVNTLGAASLSGATVRVHANSGLVEVTARDGINIAATGNLALDASNGGRVQFTATSGDVGMVAGGEAGFRTTLGTIALAGENIDLVAGSAAIAGRTATSGEAAVTFSAGSNIRLNTTGKLSLASNSADAVALTAGNDILAHAAILHAGGMGTAFFTAEAGRNIDFNASTELLLQQYGSGQVELTAGQDLALAAPNVRVAPTRLQAGRDLSLSGDHVVVENGSGLAPTRLEAGQNLIVTANDHVNILGAGGDIEFQAGDGISLSGYGIGIDGEDGVISVVAQNQLAINATQFFYAIASHGGAVTFTGDQLAFNGGQEVDLWAAGGAVALNGTAISIDASEIDLYAHSGSLGTARLDIVASEALSLTGGAVVSFHAHANAAVSATGRTVTVSGDRIAIAAGNAGSFASESLPGSGTVDITAGERLTFTSVGTNASDGIYVYGGPGSGTSDMGSVHLEATTGDLTMSALRQLAMAGRDGQLDLIAGGQAAFSGDTVRLMGDGTTGQVAVTAGGIAIDAATDLAISAASLSSSGRVILDADSALELTAGNDLTLDAGSGQIVVNTLGAATFSGNSLRVRANAGSVAVTAEDGIAVETAGNIAFEASNSGQVRFTSGTGNIVMNAGGEAGFRTLLGTITVAGHDLDLAAQSVVMAGRTASAGEAAVTLTAANDILLDAALELSAASGSGDAVALGAGRDIRAAAGRFEIGQGGTAFVTADAGRDLSLVASAEMLLRQYGSGAMNLMAGQDLTLAAGNIVVAPTRLQAGRNLALTADGILVDHGAGVAPALLKAGTDLSLTANGYLEVRGYGSVDLDAGSRLMLAGDTVAVRGRGGMRLSAQDSIAVNANQGVYVTGSSGSVSFTGDQLTFNGGEALSIRSSGGTVALNGTDIRINANNVELYAFSGSTATAPVELKATRSLTVTGGSLVEMHARTNGSVSATGTTVAISGDHIAVAAGSTGSSSYDAMPMALGGGGSVAISATDGVALISAGTATSDGIYLYGGSAGSVDEVAVTAGGLMTLQAQSNILAGNPSGGIVSLKADALQVNAGKVLDLSEASITVGNGQTDTAADSALLAKLAAWGISAPSGNPSAVFAADSVTLGQMTFYGDYLLLKANALDLRQPVATYRPGSTTVNANVLVQFTPYDWNQAIGVEAALPGSIAPNTVYFTQADHFAKFPGTTLAVGHSNYSGTIVIGSNGVVDIGSKHFAPVTQNSFSGLENIVTTGVVVDRIVTPEEPGEIPEDAINVITLIDNSLEGNTEGVDGGAGDAFGDSTSGDPGDDSEGDDDDDPDVNGEGSGDDDDQPDRKRLVNLEEGGVAGQNMVCR